MIVAAVLLIGVILFAVNSCNSSKRAGKQAEVSREQGQASVGAGEEALNTVGNLAAGDQATDDQVASGQEAIRNAPEGQKGKTTRKVACGFKSAANRPECKEQTP
jgi:hypothetical protein